MSGVGPPRPSESVHPRRKTLSTEDGRDIVPPQLPFFPSERSSSRRPSRPVVPITIDPQLADAAHKIRPLPRLPIPPSPKSAPPVPHRQISRSSSMRPLPCLPESGTLTIDVTPATPLPPPTPTVQSSAHLSAPCPRPGPPRFDSLSLKVQTSPDALNPRAFDSFPSPLTPTLPEPPSPRTAQRNRISKLRRHLGESVQVLLDRPDTFDVLAGLRHGVDKDTYPQKVLDLRATDSDTSSSDSSSIGDASSDGEIDDTEDYSWAATPDRVSYNRISQKWIRERGKARWTEDNFSKILQDLRNL
ncbi:hypothetical protein B0H19DRAFT_361351 [Mycena capillaripes]|nr:hypothetical protein B0H19DRAFT_361351 [Mycena capillaripes]